MIEIVRGGAERIDDLEPLWAALNEHHVAIAPELASLGPVRTRDGSWRVRRADYERWLAAPDSLVLVAEDDGRPVGYALVTFRGPEEAWASGERIGVVQTLSVLPSHRGAGLGTRLLEAAFDGMRELGAGEVEITTLDANVDSQRFYERFGLPRFAVKYLGKIPAR